MEEIKLDISDSVKKTTGTKKLWLGIVIVVILLVGVFVIAGNDNSLNKEKLSIMDSSISVEYNEYLGYSAIVKGIAKNVTSRNFDYASVEFSVYDASGNNLGTALANINHLNSGDTWNFEAVMISFSSTRPTTYKLVEIIAI